MNELHREKEDFIGFEYKKVTVPEAQAMLYLDGYKSFGWTLDDRFGTIGTGASVTLKLRRDRKIIGRMELTRLQRNFEANMEELNALEASKTKMPRIAALTAGMIGTAFMAGATFAVTAAPPLVWLCVLLAVPGFVGWLLPYYLYKGLARKRSEIVAPLLEQKYDEIYELCKKGGELLN